MGVIRKKTCKGLKLEKESAKQDKKKKRKKKKKKKRRKNEEECRGADPAHMIFFLLLNVDTSV
jgi:hypothetical protein